MTCQRIKSPCASRLFDYCPPHYCPLPCMALKHGAIEQVFGNVCMREGGGGGRGLYATYIYGP